MNPGQARKGGVVKRLVAVMMIALSGVALSASPCWACSCMQQTKEEQADNADVVIFAKVREIIAFPDDGTYGDDNIRVKVRVRTVYKGKNITRFKAVRTNESGAACGYESFEVGERYTIFADRTDGKLFTNLCSGTKKGDINPENYGLPPGQPPEE